jgi:hypoxanthine-guanine phosphoribosyltransferase
VTHLGSRSHRYGLAPRIGDGSTAPEPKVLIHRDLIRERVPALGAQVERDHPDGSLVVLGVLKGSFVFLADLARAIARPLRVGFFGVQSYGSARPRAAPYTSRSI